MEDRKLSCVIPTIVEDYKGTRDNIYSVLRLLPVDRIVFIGPAALQEHIQEDCASRGIEESKVQFVEENELIPFQRVAEAYDRRVQILVPQTGDSVVSKKGWYYQQFLKMAYHTRCEDEYYLCWDADTLPLRRIDMFYNGKPCLDVKTEYQPHYFETIYRLFGIRKAIESSFIAEHMLFKTSYMAEMIGEIMTSDFEGETFYEKIISGLSHMHMGFSEFETYGTWVAHRHRDSYVVRDWRSLRNTNYLIDRRDLTDEDIRWLATGFDAASFEKYQETVPALTEFFRNPRYREKLTADVFYRDLLEMGVFGEYKDGGIIDGDSVAPV